MFVPCVVVVVIYQLRQLSETVTFAGSLDQHRLYLELQLFLETSRAKVAQQSTNFVQRTPNPCLDCPFLVQQEYIVGWIEDPLLPSIS